jgi:hypothetical protein
VIKQKEMLKPLYPRTVPIDSAWEEMDALIGRACQGSGI